MKTFLTWAVVLAIGGGGLWYWWQHKAPAATENAVPTSINTDTETAVPSTAAGINGLQNQTNTGLDHVPPVVSIAHDAKNVGYLVATNGMTLYTFDKDAKGVSTCKDACATTWPPYIVNTKEPLVTADGVKGLLASATRTDGSVQLTYNGLPVYFFKNDTKVGDATGDNLNKVWHIIQQ